MSAGTFEIVIKGTLSPTLLMAFDGFELSHCDQGRSHLIGWVPDQAQLHSTIQVMRDLNIELISVNPVSPS